MLPDQQNYSGAMINQLDQTLTFCLKKLGFENVTHHKNKGEHDISLGVRILSVCNTYDAMTSDRPHRKALEEITVKEFLEYNSGKKFDPQVVKSFLDELSLNKEMQKFH